MSRRVLIPLIAVAALVVLGGAGAYAYFFSSLRTSPATLALSSPSPRSPAPLCNASSVGLPLRAATGQPATASVPGKLTLHGVTRDVRATLQLRVSAASAQVAGTIPPTITDLGVNPPSIGFTTVQPAVR